MLFRSLFVINAFSFNIKGEPDTLVDVYPEIFEYQQYAADNNLHFIVGIEMCNEAPRYTRELEYLINYIKEKCNLTNNDIINMSGAHYFDNPDIKHAHVTSIIGNDKILENNSYNSVPRHHFVSLARMAKSHRVAATEQILNRGLDKYGYCSCGSGYYTNPAENMFDYLPETLRNRLPLYIDCEIVGSDQNQYNKTHDAMTYAFANIVMETAFDAEFSYYLFNNVTWHLPFSTEKTMKSFAWGQVPIFITVPNHDIWLRNMGFDLFDDIVDQSYNRESNPKLRITKAIDELQKICEKPIEYWAEYKNNNITRFENNRILAEKMINGRSFYSANNLQKVLDTM